MTTILLITLLMQDMVVWSMLEYTMNSHSEEQPQDTWGGGGATPCLVPPTPAAPLGALFALQGSFDHPTLHPLWCFLLFPQKAYFFLQIQR